MSRISWEKFDLASYPGNLWGDWDLLNNAYNGGHPMLDSRFSSGLIDHYPRDAYLLAGYIENRISAMILMERNKAGFAKNYAPAQTQIALAILPKSRNDIYASILSRFHQHVLRLDLFNIDYLYHPSIENQESFVDTSAAAEDITVNVNRSFEEYWQARPSKLRQSTAKYIRRLEKDFGQYELRAVTQPDELKYATGRYGQLESTGWKGKNGTALHPSNTQGQFYSELMKKFSTTGQAMVLELYIEKKLAASQILIHSPSLAVLLKTTYSENLRKYAVGRILLYETIKYIFENGVSSVIDFYTNANRDQKEWADYLRVNYNLSIYRQPFGSYLLRPLINSKKRFPDFSIPGSQQE